MSKSANVLSVQTLKDFKVAMITFAEDARNSLSGVDMELRRMRDWLERDQLGYWQSQIKRRQEDLMQARADLHKRKISQQGSDAVSDAEQKEALREATRKLRVAEEKLAMVKRLVPLLHHAIDEYHSHSQPLGDHLSGGFEKSLFTLEKMIGSLEAYLALAAPTAPRLGSLQETGPTAASSGSSSAGDSASTTLTSDAASAENVGASNATANPTGPVETTAPAGEPVASGRTS
jgi:phage-related tail protein